MDYFNKTPSCKIYCKDDPNFVLTIRDDRVVLVPPNPSDDYQHWYRDESKSNVPSFSLINKATKLAIMHPAAPFQPVQLTPYDQNKLNQSTLWTENGNMDDGYSSIRVMNDISLCFDVHEGRASDEVDLICSPWTGGNSQVWNIEPYNYQASNNINIGTSLKIYCKKGPTFSLTIRDGLVVLAPCNPLDDSQHWYKDEKYSEVKDMFGLPSFSLVNKATGQAIKHAETCNQPVQLIAYDENVLDESVLWTADVNLGDGFCSIRMTNNITLNFDAFEGHVYDGVRVICYPWCGHDNQRWIMEPYYDTKIDEKEP